ncbi:hypothetical protein [Calderihabitans maritimus]|uniref:DUF4878 domain-containing protein n=1 Tax=Calderihabitans maritimus TaxID=1246530 RepID=A0A1Z5HPI2_9FIRM|nr:hypothetical protein [Calderihabitans maritimus]GAW91231.1 hypothetical protein KKC1_03930 [Calderihabitans maritimus]
MRTMLRVLVVAILLGAIFYFAGSGLLEGTPLEGMGKDLARLPEVLKEKVAQVMARRHQEDLVAQREEPEKALEKFYRAVARGRKDSVEQMLSVQSRIDPENVTGAELAGEEISFKSTLIRDDTARLYFYLGGEYFMAVMDREQERWKVREIKAME